MNTSHLNDIMDLVFDHKQTMPEQTYIDMCNCLKHAHNLTTGHTNVIRTTKERIHSLTTKYNLKLNEDYKKITKPNLNNEMKFIAMFHVAKKHDMISERIRFVTTIASIKHIEELSSDDKAVECYLYTTWWMGDTCIDCGFNCLQENQFSKKRPPSTKLVNDMKQYLMTNGTDEVKNDVKNTYDTVQNNSCIRLRNKFYDEHMKPILEDIKFLESVVESL